VCYGGRDADPWMPEGVTLADNDVIAADSVKSVVIEFKNADPFLDQHKKDLKNTFGNNTVVGNAIFKQDGVVLGMDSRIAKEFQKEIILAQ
jgi:hypothetical protein